MRRTLTAVCAVLLLSLCIWLMEYHSRPAEQSVPETPALEPTPTPTPWKIILQDGEYWVGIPVDVVPEEMEEK